MAIESNLRNSLLRRTQCSLSRDAASSLVSRTCVSPMNFKLRPAPGCNGPRKRNTRRTEFYVTLGAYTLPETQPPAPTARVAHPLIRDEIKSPDSVLSSIFAPQHQRRSTRLVCDAPTRIRVFFFELDRRICSSFSDKFLV